MTSLTDQLLGPGNSMQNRVTLRVNGKPVTVPPGTLVAAAIAIAGDESSGRDKTAGSASPSLGARFRSSPMGHPRGPLCGMGICFECRVILDGRPNCRACLIECRDGMEARTDA